MTREEASADKSKPRKAALKSAVHMIIHPAFIQLFLAQSKKWHRNRDFSPILSFRIQLCLFYGCLYGVALSFFLPQIFNFALVIPLAFFDDFFRVWRVHHPHPCKQYELRCLILPCFTVFWASYALIGELIEAHMLYFQYYSFPTY